jgi:c-di-GMP-binding flagellar brake protein YcgR
MVSMSERRRKKRYDLQLGLEIWPCAGPQFSCTATTINVSASGMLFVLHSGNPDNLRRGAAFRFNLELADSGDDDRVWVVGKGYVVRIDDEGDHRFASIITSWRLVHQTVENGQVPVAPGGDGYDQLQKSAVS